ncbi:hypothetical protein AAC387_Pa02g2477 [Persea americana]
MAGIRTELWLPNKKRETLLLPPITNRNTLVFFNPSFGRTRCKQNLENPENAGLLGTDSNPLFQQWLIQKEPNVLSLSKSIQTISPFLLRSATSDINRETLLL